MAFFCCIVQTFSDKTATTLKSTALIVLSVHAALVNFMYSFRRWLNENDHTVVGYVPVECTVAKEAAWVSSEAERPIRYQFTEKEEIEM